MVDDLELGMGPDRAVDTLQYHPHEEGFHESWKGGAHVSYFDKNGGSPGFRVLETNAPENIPLILGGVKKCYIGDNTLMRHLSAMQEKELVFVHHEQVIVPVIIDSIKTKSYGDITLDEWKAAGHKDIDSYIDRLGSHGNQAHAAVRETLTHTTASVIGFHVANAEELQARNLDPEAVANHVRAGRVHQQRSHPDAETKATQLAVGFDEEAGHSFQAETGKTIAAMRTLAQGMDHEGAKLATGAKR
jgi:hypothetical protein